MVKYSNKESNFLFQDVAIIALSVLLAIVIVRANILSDVLYTTQSFKFIGSFVAGMFFTSIFTTAPAMATLGEIARTNSLFLTAFLGAFGALLGDLIIFRFIRDRLSDHLVELVQHKGVLKRLRALFRLRYFRWFTFFAGGLILASPLPDELGIALLGFSKVKVSNFIPISFFFNFVGILLIGLVARAI